MQSPLAPKRIFTSAAAALALATFGIQSSQAAVLTLYTFTGSSDASSDTDPLTSSSDLSVGAGFTNFNTYNITQGSPAPSRAITGDAANQTSNLLSGNFYFEFTLTPTAGVTYNLTSLTFDFGASFSQSTQIGWAVYSSVAGFNGNAIASTSFASNTQAANTFTQQTVNLSAAGFQNRDQAITFRLYISDGASTSGSQTRFDNLTLNGVAVPEPQTYALIGLGLAALLFFRKRKQTA